MAKIKYRIRGTADKTVAIKVYLSNGRSNFVECSTGYFIHPIEWNGGLGLPFENTAENRELRDVLVRLKAYLEKCVATEIVRNVSLDMDWARNRISEFSGVISLEENRDCDSLSQAIKTSKGLLTKSIEDYFAIQCVKSGLDERKFYEAIASVVGSKIEITNDSE